MSPPAILRPAANFTNGFAYPFRGGRFVLSRPGLWPFVLIPLTINILIFGGAVWGGVHLFNDYVIAMIPTGDAWYYSILYYLLWVVGVIATAILVFFSFTIVGNLIASPFNEALAEKTNEIISGEKSDIPFSLMRILKDTRRIMIEELKRISAFLLLLGSTFLVNLIPGAGQIIYTLLSALVLIFFLILEYFSIPLYPRGYGFREIRRYIMRNRSVAFGFGCGVFCLLAIPLMQLLCIPLAVVGAVLLQRDFPPEPKAISSDAGQDHA